MGEVARATRFRVWLSDCGETEEDARTLNFEHWTPISAVAELYAERLFNGDALEEELEVTVERWDGSAWIDRSVFTVDVETEVTFTATRAG